MRRVSRHAFTRTETAGRRSVVGSSRLTIHGNVKSAMSVRVELDERPHHTLEATEGVDERRQCSTGA